MCLFLSVRGETVASNCLARVAYVPNRDLWIAVFVVVHN